MSCHQTVNDDDIGSTAEGNESAVWSSVIALTRNQMSNTFHACTGTHDCEAAGMVNIVRGALICDSGKGSAFDGYRFFIHRYGSDGSDLFVIEYDWSRWIYASVLRNQKHLLLCSSCILIATFTNEDLMIFIHHLHKTSARQIHTDICLPPHQRADTLDIKRLFVRTNLKYRLADFLKIYIVNDK